MAKTQIGARMDSDTLDLARRRAADRGLDLGSYLSQLVLDDTTGLRQRAVGAAKRFLDDYQDVFDDAEDAHQHPAEGAHAA